MRHSHTSIPPQLTRMADGTIKQLNPFSDTEVWTVPGRANRPLEVVPQNTGPVGELGRHCSFCSDRVLETPPEKSRIVREGGPELALELEDKGYENIREKVAAGI